MVFLLIILSIKFYYVNGISSIVNGRYKPTEPRLGEVPYQASLLMHMNGSTLNFCGGSLIHPRWILTAAHCLEQNGQLFPVKQMTVALGSIYTNAKGAQRIQAEKLVINKRYFESGGNNADIGLIKLKVSAKLSNIVKTIKLHTNNQENLLSKTAYLTGFGIINDFYQQPARLRKATLHVNTADKCSMASTKTEICCTSTIAEGKACKGDSGGPLTILKNGKHIQIGVTSHLAVLPFCRIAFNNSVYTKVAAYIAWISKITGIDFSKYNPG